MALTLDGTYRRMHTLIRLFSYFTQIVIAAVAVGVSLLRGKYPFVSGPQLISEGHQICASVNGGQRSVTIGHGEAFVAGPISAQPVLGHLAV